MTDIHSVADYIIESFFPKEISLLKLQSLLYFAQGWYLALYDKPLFEEEFDARVHGPINPEIYKRFSNGCGLFSLVKSNKVSSIENDLKKFIDKVIEVYGGFADDQLITLTRFQAPWKLARKGLAEYENCENKIDKLSMKEYFTSII